MSNPQLGFDELAAAQEQPEVVVNAADRALSAAIAGAIEIAIEEDDDYELQPDQWAYKSILMFEPDPVLTTGRDVIYPDVDVLVDGISRMLFVFSNQTSETLTVKRDGGTGVAVTAGQSVLLFHDGSDIVAV